MAANPATEVAAPRARNWPRSALATVVVLAVALVAVGGVALFQAVQRSATPAEDSAEVGFARDMSLHHAQAVEMADMILDRTDDPLISHIAEEILFQQQAELGQMQGWLDAWGHPPTSGGMSMAWMGHPVEGRMPGMASAEELAALSAAEGADAEQLFLELMITHHEAGGAMIEAVLERTDRPEVIDLASRMLRVQNTEITDMEALLAAPGSEAGPGGHAGHAQS